MAGDTRCDVSELYRRAEAEKRAARFVMDGKDEREISELLGLTDRNVVGILEKLCARVQSESVEIAKVHAIKQTTALMGLYLEAQEMWTKTKDPRYAQEMRGALGDVRKIWGVDAPQRIALGGSLNVSGGILGGILGGLDDRTLDALEGLFEGRDEGTSVDGEGLPALEGLCEISGSIPLG
jgi:hypothetical protein